MKQSQKKYTVITGASSGIGYATALAFAGRGCNLILVARREEQLQALKTQIVQINPALDVVVRVGDLSVGAEIRAFYESLSSYTIQTWINNAGMGYYSSVAGQDVHKVQTLLRLNIEALTLLLTLYVCDYMHVEESQLINISSRGGYAIVPNAVTYCASKFYVGAFTEGLAHELKASGAALQAKVLAPAATRTEFGKRANHVAEYDYDKAFKRHHTAEQMAQFMLELYDSKQVVGIVDAHTFDFQLRDTIFPYANHMADNQR